MSRPPRIAWAPLPILLLALIGLWFKNMQAPYEPPELLIALNLLLATLPGVGIAFLFARNFLITGAPGVALLGCGAVLWSTTGLSPLIASVASPSFDVNAIVTIHNLAVWVASLCYLAGCALLQRRTPALVQRPPVLLAAYALAVAAAAFLAFVALQGWTPLFFVQGKGPSLERQFVLGSTIFAIFLTLLLLRKGVILRSSFLDWFALALMLVAVGYIGFMLQTTLGGVLGWVSRAALFLGGGYMLIAAYAAFRDAKPAFVVVASPNDEAPHRYSVAIAIVLTAAVLRLVFLQGLGTSFAFITFYPSVMLAALYGGLPAGALATFSGALLADYFWVEPVRSLLVSSPMDWLALAIFALNCLLISWMVDLLQKARARLRRAEAGRRAELERMVAERSAELGLAKEAKTQLLAAATGTETELQTVLDAVPAGIWIARDPSYRTVQANRLATAWMRIPEGANSSKSAPSLLRFEIFDKDGLPLPNEQLPLRRAAGGEEVTDYEFEWRFSDGERRFFHGNATPLRDAEGNVAGAVAAFIDNTERKRAEEALRESEERYRGIFQHAATGIAITDLQGRFQSCNPAFAAILGYTEQELLSLDFHALVHPEDRAENVAAGVCLRAQRIPSFELFNRYIRKDGTVVWVHKHISLLRDAAGKPTHHVALVTDMSERKRHEEQVNLLMREVNHRAKNMLALVQAIARQTVATHPKSFVEHFGKRLRALAASQDLLVKAEWKGVDLGELIHSQLEHFSGLIGSRINLVGPAFFISASAAQTIGMALHELATNAGKYGALSTDAGGVDVSWGLKCAGAEERFVISWHESGGPPVTPPAQTGFGSMVIARTVQMSLDATVDLEFAAGGLRWRLECASDRIIGARDSRDRQGAAKLDKPASLSKEAKTAVKGAVA